MRDPYAILGVGKSADEAEIKNAFRKRAKALHPDRNTSDPKAQDKFAELNSAYEILGDATKRAQFDRGEIDAEGKPRFQGFEGFGGGHGGPREGGFESFSFGFGGGGPFAGRTGRPGGDSPGGDDIFSHLFGEAMRGGRQRRPAKGEDVTSTLTVTVEDIASEAKKRIALPTGREVEVMIPRGVATARSSGSGALATPVLAAPKPGMPCSPSASLRTSASPSRRPMCACASQSNWRTRSSAPRSACRLPPARST